MLYLIMFLKNMTLLARKVLKIRRSTLFGTPGIYFECAIEMSAGVLFLGLRKMCYLDQHNYWVYKYRKATYSVPRSLSDLI